MRDGEADWLGDAPGPAEATLQEGLADDLAHAVLTADLLALPRTRAALAKALAILDAETAPAPGPVATPVATPAPRPPPARRSAHTTAAGDAPRS